MQQHTGGVRTDTKRTSDFLVAHIVQVSQAECLGFLGRQLIQQLPDPVGQLPLLCLFCGARSLVFHGAAIVGAPAAIRPAESPTELIYCAGGCQPSQQSRKTLHALAPADIERRDESFLETIGCIGVIAQQPIRRLPDGRAVFFDNCLPINHLSVPSELS